MVNRDRVQVCRVHEAQNRQQGRVRTQPWQSPDKDDVQDGAGIFHVACPGKDMPVFVNAVAFAVAASEIVAVSI